jgi:hypothetical protein
MMMRNTKRTLVALAGLAFIPTASVAGYVYAPHPGTVTATTYTSSGAFHGAVDISSGRCNYWGVQVPLVGSLFWDVTIRTTGIVCYGSGSGNQNEVKHVFADGRAIRMWHFIKTADSYDRTCDRCQIGNEGGTGNVTGPHTHIQVDNSGTKDTSWYSGYTVNGEVIDAVEIIGAL